MNRTLRCAAVLVAVVASASVAGAQARATTGSTELGVDGELAFNRYDNSADNTTTLSLPVQRFRMGFNADQQLEIEPWGALNYASLPNSASLTALQLGVGALWHFSTNRAETQWYLRPFTDITHESSSITLGSGATNTTSSTQWGLGVGFGAKLPISDRFGARFEGNIEHRFKGGDFPAGNVVGLLAGLSFFTH